MKVYLDKIAAVCHNIPMQNEVVLKPIENPQIGDIIAVKVLEEEDGCDKIELGSGKVAHVKKGDVIAVSLGNRRALRGSSSMVPTSLKQGDTLHIVAMAGVAGTCLNNHNDGISGSTKVEFLGGILSDEGSLLNMKDYTLFAISEHLQGDIPIIIISGSCMNVGKTKVNSTLIKKFVQNGYKVCGGKMTGVASLIDKEKMKDFGALEAVTFMDYGLPSTVANELDVVNGVKSAINYLSSKNPDVIVLEMGDGVLGDYNVRQVLEDNEIQKNTKIHIGCGEIQSDSAKIIEVGESMGLPISIISGPITDNIIGKDFIKKNYNIPTHNAQNEPEELFIAVENLFKS